ncbi:MAG: creatininase family protein [bacterium]|jgi:creatinine amidohydrolase/Fe(II)-dependent formamide hydrolase-like protein
MKTYLLEEMTWPEIREAMETGYRTVIIAAASIEQHGPHLALLTDSAIGQASAVDLAKRLGNALVAPVIRPGLSSHHLSLPGTLSLRPEVFTGLVEDYVISYVKHGFENIILFSSHGGNFDALEKMAADLQEKYPQVRIVTGISLDAFMQLLAKIEKNEGVLSGTCGGHACDFETSVMLFLHDTHVRMEKAQQGYVGKPSPQVLDRFFKEGVTAVSPIGVMGDPSGADVNRGRRYFEELQKLLTETVSAKLDTM